MCNHYHISLVEGVSLSLWLEIPSQSQFSDHEAILLAEGIYLDMIDGVYFIGPEDKGFVERVPPLERKARTVMKRLETVASPLASQLDGLIQLLQSSNLRRLFICNADSFDGLENTFAWEKLDSL